MGLVGYVNDIPSFEYVQQKDRKYLIGLIDPYLDKMNIEQLRSTLEEIQWYLKRYPYRKHPTEYAYVTKHIILMHLEELVPLKIAKILKTIQTRFHEYRGPSCSHFLPGSRLA